MNESQTAGAMRGIIEAMIEAQPNLTEKKRLELLHEMMTFEKTQNPYPIVHMLISLLGGNSEQLMKIPVKLRKEKVYMFLADELERHAATLSENGSNRIVEYFNGYAKYYREMPPVMKGLPLSNEAAQTAQEWAQLECTFNSLERAAVRDQLYALAKSTSNLHVKTTLLMNWVFMSREIDWDAVEGKHKQVIERSHEPGPFDEVMERLLGSLLRKVGLGIVDSHDTVKNLLNEHLDGGAESVDSDTFMRLCKMTGPEVYAEITRLVRAEKQLRDTSGKKREKDEKLEAIRSQALHKLAIQDGAMTEAAKYVEKREAFRRKLRQAGLGEEEIDAQVDEYDRYVFEATRNNDRRR